MLARAMACRSALCGALRRAGGELGLVVDVDGDYEPEGAQTVGDRLYGQLSTHDASLRLGFDAKSVPLPFKGAGSMRVSGKLWLDERTGAVTLMVRRYRYL